MRLLFAKIKRALASKPLPTLVQMMAAGVLRNLLAGLWLPLVPAIIAKTRRARGRNAPNVKLVVFVCQVPRVREAKLASGLKTAGWQVILLHQKAANWNLDAYFDRVCRYQNQWQALWLACRFHPVAYHVFSLDGDPTARVFIRYKPGRVVFDTNDVIQGMLLNPSLRTKQWIQNWCVQNADALCCRDLQVQFLTRQFSYRKPPQVIFFPEYCWHRNPAAPRPKTDPEDIHAVLAGNFGIEKRGEGHWGYLKIAEKLVAQKIHFHIYLHWFWYSAPPGVFERTFSDYLELERRSPYFHLHPSLPMDEVVPELSRYDLGISVVRALSYKEPLKAHTPSHYYHCGSARISDYLDAGLPVLTNKALAFQFFTASRYGEVIDATPATIDNLRAYLRDKAILDSPKRSVQTRQGYMIDSHIHRLTRFYESL